MADSTIQATPLPFMQFMPSGKDTPSVSSSTGSPDVVAMLAAQYHVSEGVARSLYRQIVQNNPTITPVSLLAQFAQAVAKRKLASGQSSTNSASDSKDVKPRTSAGKDAQQATATAQPKQPNSVQNNAVNTRDAYAPAVSTNQFWNATATASTSGLSSDAYRKVTQDASAGPVLPPPAFQPSASQTQALGQTLQHLKVAHLDPYHPNWAAFYVAWRDSQDVHTMDRMMATQLDASLMAYIQGESLETGAELTVANVQKERNDAVLDAVMGGLSAREDMREDAAGRLVNSNSVEYTKELTMQTASQKAQHQGPFRDLLREDAISLMAGARTKGQGANFMDVDEKIAQTHRMELDKGIGSEDKSRAAIHQYRPPTDAATQQLRDQRKVATDRLKNNGSMESIDLDRMILTQALPGQVHATKSDKHPITRVQRRFLTQEEIKTLSPEEHQHYKTMLEGFYTARMKDLSDRVQAVSQEIGGLRSAAALARREAAEPTAEQVPEGTSREVYQENCTRLAGALDRKAVALKTEMLNGDEIAKQYVQHLAFTNRVSMRKVMQHAKWLRSLAEKVRTEVNDRRLDLSAVGVDKNLDDKQRLDVMEETASAIERRLFDLLQSVIPYRGDDHQTGPLQRNERLNQFKTAPGAKKYNEVWDAHDTLAAKSSRTPEEDKEMVELRNQMYWMHKAAPAQVWETWKLDRLKAKVDTLRADPSKQAEAQAAEQHLRSAITTATERVDSKWMGLVMDRHLAERHKDLIQEAHEKAQAESDPTKRASLLRDEAGLRGQLKGREAFWSKEFDRSKSDGVRHKAQAIATEFGFGPKIKYRNDMGKPAEPIAPLGRNAGVMGSRAGIQKAAEIKQRRGGDNAPPATPAESKAIREEVAQAHHEAAQAAQENFERPAASGVAVHDDAWLANHVDPGANYLDSAEMNKRYERTNEALGASLNHWDDSIMDTMHPAMNTVRDLGKTFEGVSGNNSVAQNLTQETASMAGSLWQEVQGDFSAMYDQIMAMRSRLLPLTARVNPWG